MGVNLKGDVFIYGAKSGMFGSEPWLITLGNNVHITGECQFITHDGSTLILRKKVPDLEITAPIEIGDDVFIGFSSTILTGVTIGNGSIIGAGSIVNKNIPANSVAVGNPCKVIKTTDELLEKFIPLSLKLGHLKGKVKEKELMKYFKKIKN
jgi:acetyltransferase-like isoleucine patch superfamily enzyme